MTKKKLPVSGKPNAPNTPAWMAPLPTPEGGPETCTCDRRIGAVGYHPPGTPHPKGSVGCVHNPAEKPGPPFPWFTSDAAAPRSQP